MLARVAAGDQEALRAIYERDKGFLFAVALRLIRDREAAEDILQEGFELVWKRAATFVAVRGSGRGWIYTIVRNQALTALRRRQRSPISYVEDAAEYSDIPECGEGRSRSMDSADLHACLKLLAPTEERCILLACCEGYTHEQVAGLTGFPVGSVKSWIRRGLLKLRGALQAGVPQDFPPADKPDRRTTGLLDSVNRLATEASQPSLALSNVLSDKPGRAMASVTEQLDVRVAAATRNGLRDPLPHAAGA